MFYKLDELRALVSATKPAFICVTESWLTSDISDDLVRIRGYEAFRNDRCDDPSDTRRGGGTIIYCSSSLRASVVCVPQSCHKPHGIECNFIKFTDFDSSLAFMFCLYIPPNLNSETFAAVQDYIVNCLDYVLNTFPEASLYVCGDFNRYDMSFFDDQFNLSNIVSLPTFGNNVLDKFFCFQHVANYFSVKTAPPLGSAIFAHNIVFVSRHGSKINEKLSPQKVFDLRESNVSAFRKKIAAADWSFLLKSHDIYECIYSFYDILQESLSIIPVSYVYVTPKTKPWITPVIIDLINKRWAAYKAKNFSLYNHYKAKVKTEIIKSKKIWCNRMCKSSKGIWSIVNDVRGKDNVHSSHSLFSLFSDPVNAVETINLNFSRFFTESDSFPLLPVNHQENFEICSERSIFDLLINLRTDKACGSDGVNPIFLKTCADVICRPLSHLINLSFQQGVFPNVWKMADVCPIPKSRPVNIDQLRPISLLPTVSKICERSILNKFSESLLNFYDNCQFAYRPKSSTTCALVTLHETVLDFLDNIDVGAVRVITFDMSRAFDRIPHHMLLSCLSSLDMCHCNLFVNWTNSYLSNRQQRIKLGNFKSSPSHVSSGVPQGSILGPILFAIYFSSYKPSDVKIRVIKYADDITFIVPVYKTSFDDMSRTNAVVLSFEKWCENHGMSINFTKTKVLNVNFSHSPLLAIRAFDNVRVLKILGLHFNAKLTWLDHFNFVTRKASPRLYILRILKPLLSHDNLVIVFYALVQSILDYASSLFINAPAYLESKFLSICKRAFRVIHGHDVKSCNECDILNFHSRRKFLAMKLFDDALSSHAHVLHNLLPPFSHRSNRLVLPFARTKRKSDGFVFTCSKLYNERL